MGYNLIITEGRSDICFLNQYLTHLNLSLGRSKNNGWNISSCDGKNNLSTLKEIIEKHRDQYSSNRCCIIFDDDNDITKATENIQQQLGASLYSQIEIFLFPTDLETLLEKCVNLAKKDIIDQCFKNYEECLKELSNRTVNKIQTYTPIQKSKIYSYVEVQFESKKQKEQAQAIKRDYTNTDIWDLDSLALTDLKTFLTK